MQCSRRLHVECRGGDVELMRAARLGADTESSVALREDVDARALTAQMVCEWVWGCAAQSKLRQ